MSKSAIAVGKPLVKTLIFAVATSLVLVFVSIELGGFTFDDRNPYSAIFADASDLQEGDSVLVSGVEVGSVSGVESHRNTQAKVNIDVRRGLRLDKGTAAAVRYRNLTGDRYLELVPGPAGAEPLEPGGTIPVEHTRPALDLDVLLGGLQPLFEGLDPQQVNQLAGEMVSVLQGQGGTLESILDRVASFSSSLAEKDAVIGRVVRNLNSVLANLDTHSVELSETIGGMQKLASGLADDRSRLGKSFDDVNRLVASTNGLLTDLRGPFSGMVKELGRTAKEANSGADTINQVLRMLPGAYLRIGRLGSRGAGYNLYLCSLRLRLTGPDGKAIYTPWIGPADNIERCKPGVAPLETPEEREQNEQTGAKRSGR